MNVRGLAFTILMASTLGACSAPLYDVGGDHVALADRHDFDDAGNAFLRFEEDRTLSFFVSGAEFSGDDWRGLSVRKQRVIEDDIKSADGFLVQNIELSRLSEGASLSLSPQQYFVIFSEPGRFLDDEEEVVFAIDDIDVEPTSGSLEGTLSFSSKLFEEGTSQVSTEQHLIELNLSLGRERVMKSNLATARNYFVCVSTGDNCF